MMPATQPIPQPTMQQHPKRQQLSLKDQLFTMPPTTVPHSNTTPLNTTNLAQFLTVHHLALSPRGAPCPGGPQDTTATPSWCQETLARRERPGSPLRSLAGNRLPTHPRLCPSSLPNPSCPLGRASPLL